MVVHHGVILAAGAGCRLRSVAPSKPLALVAGRTLIRRAIDQMVAAGCTRVVVVVGADDDDLSGHIEPAESGVELRVVINDARDTPNGVSLAAVEDHVGDAFYMMMADHVFTAPVLDQLRAAGELQFGHARLLVDHEPNSWCENDATRVLAADGRALAIGKTIERWNCIDAGVFLLGRSIFDALLEAGMSGDPSVTDAMRVLIARGGLEVVAIRDVEWIDVDTPADLGAAERLVSDRSGGC